MIVFKSAILKYVILLKLFNNEFDLYAINYSFSTSS